MLFSSCLFNSWRNALGAINAAARPNKDARSGIVPTIVPSDRMVPPVRSVIQRTTPPIIAADSSTHISRETKDVPFLFIGNANVKNANSLIHVSRSTGK